MKMKKFDSKKLKRSELLNKLSFRITRDHVEVVKEYLEEHSTEKITIVKI